MRFSHLLLVAGAVVVAAPSVGVCAEKIRISVVKESIKYDYDQCKATFLVNNETDYYIRAKIRVTVGGDHVSENAKGLSVHARQLSKIYARFSEKSCEDIENFDVTNIEFEFCETRLLSEGACMDLFADYKR